MAAIAAKLEHNEAELMEARQTVTLTVILALTVALMDAKPSTQPLTLTLMEAQRAKLALKYDTEVLTPRLAAQH